MTKVPPALPQMRAELGLSLVESGLHRHHVQRDRHAGRHGRRRALRPLRPQAPRACRPRLLMAAGGLLGAAAWGFVSLARLAHFIEGVGFIAVRRARAGADEHDAAATRATAPRRSASGAAYMPTGGTIALLAAPLIIAWGWRALWLVFALAASFAAVALRPRGAASTPRSQVESLRLVTESLTQPGNLAMALLFACYVAQWTSIMVWLPTFLVDEHGSPPPPPRSPPRYGAGQRTGQPHRRLAARARRAARHAGHRRPVIAALCEVGMLVRRRCPAARASRWFSPSRSAAGVIPASIFSGLPVHARSPQHIGTGNGMVMQFSQHRPVLRAARASPGSPRASAWHATLWALLAFAAGAAACGVAIGADRE